MAVATTALLTALAVGGCSSAGGSGSSNGGSASGLPATIPLTLIADKTGTQAFYGTQLEAGVKAGIDYVNHSGQLGKSKLALTVEDTGSNTATATTLMSQAVQSNVPVVLGPSLSGEDLATTPLAQAAKMPYLVQASPPGILQAGNYVYSITTPQESQTSPLVKKIAQQAKSVAIIYANDNPTMNSLGPKYASELTQAGAKVTATIGVAIAATDYSAAVSRALSGSPDAVGVISGGPMMPSVTKALRTAGFKGQIFGPEGADGTIDSAGSAANGFQFTTEWAPDLSGQQNKDFKQKMASLYPSLAIHYPAVDGYTEILFVANALAKAKSTDHTKVLAALQQVASAGFAGPGGSIKFGGDGNRQLIGPAILVQFNDGKTSEVKG